MNTFVLEKFDDEGERCTFYTVRWDKSGKSETEKFLEKYATDKNFVQPIQELVSFIFNTLGNELGAMECFFRFERDAQALPPAGSYQVGDISIYYPHFPLRLFCLRISDNLVILFNGGEKTSHKAQDGNTSMAFYEANAFAKRILEALNDKEIYITEDGCELRCYNESEEIIL